VTDGYNHAVKSYLHSFQNPDSYRKTIVGIHKYYYTTTRFSTISFSECVNEIVKHFIPEDFFDSTTNQQRDGILRQNLMNAVKQFSSDVLCSNMLDNIIDNHKDITLVRRMQDKMVQALMFEREKMFQKIFNVSHKPKDSGDFTIVMKMKKEMTKLVKENHILTSKYKKIQQKALKLLEIVKEQRKQIKDLEEQISDEVEVVHEQINYKPQHEPTSIIVSETVTEPTSPTPEPPIDHHPIHNFNNFKKEQEIKETNDNELIIPPDQGYTNVKLDNSYHPNVTRENLLTIPSSTLTGNISLKPEDEDVIYTENNVVGDENKEESDKEESDKEGTFNSVGPTSNSFFNNINID
jgi:hypothetical protein